MSFAQHLHRAYEDHLVATGKEQAFWLLVSFLITFSVTRFVTHAIRAKHGPFRNIQYKGKHLHHLVPGIILLLISGYCAAAFDLRLTRTLDAIVFGIGAALTLDEFALWLHLKDVYWTKQGRSSVDVVIIVAVILFLIVLGSGFWIAVAHLLF